MLVSDKDVRVLILRNYLPEQTEGRVLVFNERNGVEFECFSLELPWKNNQRRISCIPEGVYDVIKHVSPKFGECFWIQNVPNRSEILVHLGNYVTEILGCVLVGNSLADINKDGLKDVTSSRATMSKLLEILPDKFKIEIKKA